MGTAYVTELVGGVIATYNDNGPSDDAAETSANQVKYATITSDLTAPLHSAIVSIDAKLLAHFDVGPLAKTTAYTTVAGDYRKTLECGTGDYDIELLALASASAGYWVIIKNTSSDFMGVDVAGGGTIDGAARMLLRPYASARFQVNAAESEYMCIQHQAGFINVADFGAYGDGTNSDVAAFDAALSAVPDGGIVLVPPAPTAYYLDSAIAVPPLKSIRLLGGMRTLIHVDHVGNGFYINAGAGGGKPKYIIDGLDLVSQTAGSGIGIQLDNSGTNIIQNCRFEDFSKGGSQINTGSGWTERNTWRNCQFNSNDFGLHFDASASSSESMATTNVLQCQINCSGANAAVPYGIYIATSTSIYRGRLDVNIFPLKNDAVAFYCDGNMRSVTGSVHVEAQEQAGAVGLQFGANSENLLMNLFCDIRGFVGSPTSQVVIHASAPAVRGVQMFNAGNGVTQMVLGSQNQTLRAIEEADGTVLWKEHLLNNDKYIISTPATSRPQYRIQGASTIQYVNLIQELNTATETANSQTPDVDGVAFLNLSNTGATTVTQFGQTTTVPRLLVVKHGNGNTTIQDNANITNIGGTDFTGAAGVVQLYVMDGSGNWFELSQSAASA